MKDLRGTAVTAVAASLEQCFVLLEDVERYPEWYPSVVRRVAVIDRDGAGRPIRARTQLHVAHGPIIKEFDLTMAVATQRPSAVTLSKVGGSQQRFDVGWRLRDGSGSGTRIEVDLRASLDVPRFIPVGGIGDAIAQGFVVAARDALSRDARA